MNGRFKRASIAAGLLLALLAVAATAGNTYMTDLVPNVEVTEPDCYEFTIYVDQASGSSAILTLRVNDVDEEAGELDEVYLNGVYLGVLSGTNDTWSTTSFNITSQIIYNADNTVRICIDPGGGEATDWRAEIDWGQILVDGGSAADADIVTVSASGTWNAISVQTNVSATHTDDFRLEINLLDSTNNNKDIATEVFHLTGGSSTTRTMIVSLPSEPTATETFTIEANLFNDTTGVQQTVKTTTWTYSADEPPTDIILSNAHVDENLPALSLVGTLAAVDADSGSHDFTLIGGDIAAFTISGNELRTSISFNYEGKASYSLHIEAEDAEGNTCSEWFTITIDDVNEAPVITDIPGQTIAEGVTFATISLDAFVADVDNADAEITWTWSGNSELTVTIDGSRVATIGVPHADWNGTETITFRATDPGALWDEDAATFTVTAENDAPAGSDIPDQTIAEGGTFVTISLDSYVADVDNADAEITWAYSGNSELRVTIDGSRVATIGIPHVDWNGAETITFRATDPGALWDEDAATFTVTPVNDPPSANADTASVIEGSTVSVDVLANDTDPDNGALNVTTVTDPANGTATIQPDDTIEYSPDPGACGIDTFSYTIEDGNGESSSASVTITIQNVSPTANSDAAETQEDESVLIAVMANDSDPGGKAPIIHSVGSPRYGRAVAIGDKIRYTPQPRFEGSDRFSYTIQDDCGASETAWVDVDVLHTNHPPVANVVGAYQGVVDEPLVLDASFSYDSDIEDTLQYRWDLNGSGVANTGWLSTPRYTATYSAPFFGQIILEVRDLYRGIPTGEIARATSLVRIASLQSIQVFVFEDLDGNGVREDGEPGMPGIGITVDGEAMTTEADGGISVTLGPGSWDIAMTAQSISNLESRGFAVLETERTVDLGVGAIEVAALGVVKTSTKVTGFVYADLDEDGEFDEDIDQLLQGLRVVLDEDRVTLTDDAGRFFFLGVLFGEHILWIGENVDPTEGIDTEDLLGLSVPITLERGASTEFSVLWPWPPVGSDQGFLDVEVEKSGNR